MNVLIACEESQRVCNEFRKIGHNAFSCDIINCSGGHPEWHIKQDVVPLLGGQCKFTTVDGVKHEIRDKWDLIVAHPPCTFLTISGNRWFNIEKYGERAIQRHKDREEAVKFFMEFVNADCNHIAIENPIGYMNTHYRKPDQTIHPYMFGHPVSKATCLWLKNLPKLTPTDIVDPEWIKDKGRGKRFSGAAWYATDENGKILSWNDPRTAKIRSKTFPGIARAMAEQWSEYIEN